MSFENAVPLASQTTTSAHAEALKTIADEPGTLMVVPVNAPRPLPSPEQVFAEWLLWVPRDADLAAAAREQIAAIDRRGLDHPKAQYLRTLLVAVAGGSPRPQTLTNL